MPHIHTLPGQHDATVSAFIVRQDLAVPKLLLHRHKRLGKLIQPGGHIELNENPWQAILREIAEETGYEPEQLKVLQPKERLMKLNDAVLHPTAVCQNTHGYGGNNTHKHTDTGYAFTATSEPFNKPNSDESVELVWLDLVELEELPGDQIITNVIDIARFVLTTCLHKWMPVELNDFTV